MKKKLLLVLVLVLISSVFVGCGAKSISLNDYVTVEVSGYDTLGSAYYDLDYLKLEEDVAKALKINTNPTNLNDIKFEDFNKLDSVLSSFVLNFDKDDSLSNGEKITLSATINEEANKKNKISLSFKDIVTTVEGLEEIEVISLDKVFKDVEVSFNGTSPNGVVFIENKSDDDTISKVNFQSETMTGLKNGDKIVVSAEYSDIYDYGVLVEEGTKEYTVEGLDEYLVKYDDLDEDAKNLILKRAEEMFSANVLAEKGGRIDGSNISSYKNISSLGVQDSYFLKLKDGFENDKFNSVMIVYKLECDSYWGNEHFSDVYIAIGINNIVKIKDGSFKINTNEAYMINGYKSFDEFYKNNIMAQLDKYDVEVIKQK